LYLAYISRGLIRLHLPAIALIFSRKNFISTDAF
jgi:hypothetical protein